MAHASNHAAVNANAGGNPNNAPHSTDSKDQDVAMSMLAGDAKSDGTAAQNANAGNAAPAMEDLYIPTPQIEKFGADIKNSRGYANKAEKNLKSILSRRLNREITSMPLGRPAKNPVAGSQHFMVGTDDCDAKEHFLICCDGRVLMENRQADPVVSAISFPEHIRDIHWVTHDMVLLTAGPGRIELVAVGKDFKLDHRTTISDIHSDLLREIAPNKGHCGQFASGGFDEKLCIVDLGAKNPVLQSVKLPGSIGSVKWPTCNQNVCVSCTLDKGQYMIWDIRQKMHLPAFQADFMKNELYTHERYTDHHVLLGFGDGEIQHIDMRISRDILGKTQDPYVRALGQIEYNDYSNAFVTSGLGDFSVWKHETKGSGVAQVWSHAHMAKDVLQSSGNYTVTATWLLENCVLTASSEGYVALFDQEFPKANNSSAVAMSLF